MFLQYMHCSTTQISNNKINGHPSCSLAYHNPGLELCVYLTLSELLRRFSEIEARMGMEYQA